VFATETKLVAEVGDFNGDGAPDLVFQNSSTGADSIAVGPR
jgi:hypothetical protein